MLADGMALGTADGGSERGIDRPADLTQLATDRPQLEPIRSSVVHSEQWRDGWSERSSCAGADGGPDGAAVARAFRQPDPGAVDVVCQDDRWSQHEPLSA